MGETRVDLLHLLEDLRDAYPGATEETILTEVVANALDSGAATITLTTSPADRTVTIVDDGAGMRRAELRRYHDIASSTKTRGTGIGFAGVGIKIGLLVSEEVTTETRLGRHHIATTWHLTSRHRAPWKWIPPPGLVAQRGTAVRLTLTNALSPLLDPGFVETTLVRHFQPLFEPALAAFLSSHYPHGVRLLLNGIVLQPRGTAAAETAPIAVRLSRKRKPAAVGFIVRDGLPLREDDRGIAISTFGKVIRRGWDWLGIAPAAPDRTGGLIEAPALAECLTLNKADFIRAGARGATYLAYRKAIQEAVTRQLEAWGDLHESAERGHRRAARPVERDLETVLLDLAEDFPMLAALVEQRTGGQRTLPVDRSGRDILSETSVPALAVEEAVTAPGAPGHAIGSMDTERSGDVTTPPPAGRSDATLPSAMRDIADAGESSVAADASTSRRERRPARYGLNIQFEQRPGDSELARLIESTVWVNESHPAYRRAAVSRSEGYHVAVAAAMALAAVAVEPAKEHAFVTAFLASWGTAIERRKRGRRR
ncbi:MAG: hypothetical protein DMD81_17705 [Candidatus Rokuibacteriota bacterium]|nr:MAG: hypothetical protein DMD81_17705 [Candidatus Rokubacteria bacterium]